MIELVQDVDTEEKNTINICNQLPICKGFYVVNKLKDCSSIESGYYKRLFWSE